MREKIMTRKIALCLLALLLCVSVAVGVFALPAFADDAVADGCFTEDFESIDSIYTLGAHTVAATNENKIVHHSALALNSGTGIITEPNSDPANKVLRVGGGYDSASGYDSNNYFGSRSFVGLNDYFTLSVDFYFPTLLKTGTINSSEEDVSIIPFVNNGTANCTQLFRIVGTGTENVIKPYTAVTFDTVTIPFQKWFTLTLAVDVTNAKIDIFWVEKDDNGENVYTPVLINGKFGISTANIAYMRDTGLSYFRFVTNCLHRVAEGSGEEPTCVYWDNISVQHEFRNYYSVAQSSEAEQFRLENASILAKTTSDLLRSDYKALNSALDAYAALEEAVQSELSEEYAHLLDLQANIDDGRIYVDFDDRDIGDSLSSGLNLGDIPIDTNVLFGRATSLVANSGTGVILDPTDGDNQVFRIGGGKVAEGTEVNEWFGTRQLPEYNKKFTVSMSFYLPSVLKSGEQITIQLKGLKDTGAAGDRVMFYIRPKNGVNMVIRGTAGSAENFTSCELPTGEWFTLVIEGDYETVYPTGASKHNLNCYLVTEEGTTCFLMNSMTTYLAGGITYLRITPTFNAVSTDSDETPSYILMDNLYIAPELYLTEEALATEKAAAVELLKQYVGNVDNYITSDQEGVQSFINSLSGAFDNAVTLSAVYGKIAELKAQADEFTTLFEDYQNGKIAELEGYVPEDDYSASGWQNVQSAIEAGKTAILAATDNDGVDAALDAAKAAIDEIPDLEAELAALNEVKASAKTELAAYKNADNYREAQRTELNEAIAEGNTAIDNAADANAVNEALAAAKEKIDAIKTDAELTAEELAQAKASAKTELAAYKNADNYREAQRTELNEAITEGNTAIDNAADASAVNEALAAAKTKIDAIKTDAELTTEELAQAKTSAKAELAAYKNADEYREAQRTELNEAIAEGNTAIDNAADANAVNEALAAAKTKIDAIKTDAELTTAEELAQAKASAKAELEAYKNEEDYREAQRAELSAAVAAGSAAIDGATDLEAVNEALAAAKAEIDGIKTDAELTEEEQTTPDDGEQTTTPPEDEGEQSKSGCGGSVFAGGAISLSVVLLVICVGAVLAVKKRS